MAQRYCTNGGAELRQVIIYVGMGLFLFTFHELWRGLLRQDL